MFKFFKRKPKISQDLLDQLNQFVNGLYVVPAFSGVRFSKSTKKADSDVKFSQDVEAIHYSEELEDDYESSGGMFSEELPDNPYLDIYDYYSPERKIEMAKDYDRFIASLVSGERSRKTFVALIQEHIRRMNLKDADVYKAAGIDRRLFSHMMSDQSYQPSKDTAIAICLGLKLSYHAAMQLLHTAGYTLSSSIKRDLVFKFFIMNENYDLQMINETLYNLGYKTLGRQ